MAKKAKMPTDLNQRAKAIVDEAEPLRRKIDQLDADTFAAEWGLPSRYISDDDSN